MPFRFSGPSLVLLSVSRNVGFGGTMKVLLIGPYHTCSDNFNDRVMTIEISVF